MYSGKPAIPWRGTRRWSGLTTKTGANETWDKKRMVTLEKSAPKPTLSTSLTTSAASRVFCSYFCFLLAHHCLSAVALFPPALVAPRSSSFFVPVQPTCSVRVTSSIRCCPPNISPVTVDHDDLFELPATQGG